MPDIQRDQIIRNLKSRSFDNLRDFTKKASYRSVNKAPAGADDFIQVQGAFNTQITQ